MLIMIKLKKNKTNSFLFCLIFQVFLINFSNFAQTKCFLALLSGTPNVNQAFSLLKITAQWERFNGYIIFSDGYSFPYEPGASNLLENFNLNYPDNQVIKNVYFDLANYYFKHEKYSYAEKWFNKVKASDIPNSSLPIYYFNKGYTLFNKGRFERAKLLLEKVKFNPKYESDAHYYLGHIAYQLEDYEGASNSLVYFLNLIARRPRTGWDDFKLKSLKNPSS